MAAIDSSGTVFSRFRSVKRCSIILRKNGDEKREKKSQRFFMDQKVAWASAHIGITSVGCNDREWQSQASASKIGGVAIIPDQIAD